MIDANREPRPHPTMSEPDKMEDLRPGVQPATQSHKDVIRRLATLVDVAVGEVAPATPGSRYALLDFPDYANVGDSAIFGGQMAWMKRQFGRGPEYIAPLPEVGSGLDAIPKTSMIFLTGGGNFGDIYPRHQIFREKLLGDSVGRSVVQLPQSIHFDNAKAISDTAGAISAHGAFALLVRDHESYELAQRHFDCSLRMCPDMAFALGEVPRPVAPKRDVLLLLRGDKERVGAPLPHLPEGWLACDWMEDAEGMYPAALSSARRLALRTFNPLDLRKTARQNAYYTALALHRIDRGVRLLSTARYVITDRLHAHILCTLCGIPHAFLDNYYGKIRRFSSAFDTVWSGVTPAGSMEEAIGAAETWLTRS